MIPIRDENTKKIFPLFILVILLLNTAVFVYQWILGNQTEVILMKWGAIPWEILHFQDLPHQKEAFKTGYPNFITLFTSMFIHGGFLHFLGNMLYLWIFGDNVEALTGHLRFFVFYIICGLAAAGTHMAFDPNSTVPMVGASGAVSGVLGAYLMRFPKARIHVLFFFFIFIQIIRIPAVIVLGFWFVMQLTNGMGALKTEAAGGVAWFAHIGGFLTGAVLIFFFEKKGRRLKLI